MCSSPSKTCILFMSYWNGFLSSLFVVFLCVIFRKLEDSTEGYVYMILALLQLELKLWNRVAFQTIL